MAKYETANELALEIKAALGIEANTRRLILDLEAGSIPVLYIEALGDPIGDAPGNLSGLDWAAGLVGLQIRDLDYAGRPWAVLSTEETAPALSAVVDLGRITVKDGDLVLVAWPEHLSAGARDGLEDRFGDLFEEWGAEGIRVAILDHAERFGILTVSRES